MWDCKLQTAAYLRENLFEPHKHNTRDPPHTAFFTTDTFSRCWFPWSRPKRLYTTEPSYANYLLDIAKTEYDIEPDRISMFTQKVNDKGEFWIGIDVVPK
eukprot:TRINITY_DN47046_c0_g1_i1.p1 TRINITY_DN47046_c0_g1~~TRINITY_DN47046_c0_g1_i1.p1  ORF type:complete len:117 (+),score=24.94 TRINITY_DN47046_c0_g1_i1:54-353(+)